MDGIGQVAQQGVTQQAQTEAIQTEQPAGHSCPVCGAANEAEARYCSECGHALYPGRQCPKCNSGVPPAADFCEVCGEWLCAGQCRFCYTDLAEGAAFCEECGNPQAGIVCPDCGQPSFFDYCTACGIPLTEAAQQMAASLAADPKTKAWLAEMSAIEALEAELEGLPDAPEATPPAAPAQGFFNQRHLNAMRGLKSMMQKMADQEQKDKADANALAAAEAARAQRQQALEDAAEKEQNARLAARLKSDLALKYAEALAEFKALMASQSQRTFSNHQEARRFFMAMKPDFPGVTGWRCTCCSTLHTNPNDCADPSQGGEWMIQETP